MYYVYILKSLAKDKLYFGYTEDLKAKRDAIVRKRQLKQFKQAYSRLKERLRASLEVQS